MRIRSRVQETAIGSPNVTQVDTTWTGPFPPSSGVSDWGHAGSFIERDEEIADIIAMRPEVFVDPVTGRWKRIKYPPSSVARVFRPCHPCTHNKTVLYPEKDISIAFGKIFDEGSPSNERYVQFTDRYFDGASYSQLALSSPLHLAFSDTEKNYSADDYIKHDWFALADSFYEACDQFIPSSFHVGEDIAESDIFREAFMGLFFPTRSINRFFKHVSQHVRRARKMNLGQISKEISKQGVNAHLSYIFGVKPAIDDIKSVLKAHASVSQRMKILRSRAGHFVPIRVRQKLDSSIVNLDDPSFTMDGVRTLFTNCTEKSSIAVASAYGRVREDLTFGDTWTSYLQYFGVNKMAGLAWELIPFSFVIDWFTNAQERINSLTRLNVGGPFTEIRGFCVSSKQVLREELSITPGYNNAFGCPQTSPDHSVVLAHRVSSTYNRFLSFPDTSGVFDFSALGLFQYTASGSLFLQKLLAR